MPRLPRRAFAGLTLAATMAIPLAAQAQAPASPVRAGDIVVTQAWSRAAIRGGAGAAFLTLRNTGTQPDRLLGASTPAAGRVELHSMLRDGDVMRMREQPAIDLPPGQEVVLRPGGLHVMMLGLHAALNRGETVTLALRFERAGTVEVQVAVQAAGASGMMQHQH